MTRELSSLRKSYVYLLPSWSGSRAHHELSPSRCSLSPTGKSSYSLFSVMCSRRSWVVGVTLSWTGGVTGSGCRCGSLGSRVSRGRRDGDFRRLVGSMYRVTTGLSLSPVWSHFPSWPLGVLSDYDGDVYDFHHLKLSLGMVTDDCSKDRVTTSHGL